MSENAGILTVVALSLAIGSASMTISEAKIFEKLRRYIKRRNLWLSNLISCGYCVSHWLSIVAVAIYQPRVVISPIYILDLFVSVFAIVALSAAVQVIISLEFDRKIAIAQRMFAHKRPLAEKEAA